MDDSRKGSLTQLPEDIPTKLVEVSPLADMIATAVVAAVQAQADGGDPHQAAMRAVTDGAY